MAKLVVMSFSDDEEAQQFVESCGSVWSVKPQIYNRDDYEIHGPYDCVPADPDQV